MFSERINDGIQRDPAQYFKRYNGKAPERGGCRKDSMGTLERLQTFRASWAELTNQALEWHGHEARIDHLSLTLRFSGGTLARSVVTVCCSIHVVTT